MGFGLVRRLMNIAHTGSRRTARAPGGGSQGRRRSLHALPRKITVRSRSRSTFLPFSVELAVADHRTRTVVVGKFIILLSRAWPFRSWNSFSVAFYVFSQTQRPILQQFQEQIQANSVVWNFTAKFLMNEIVKIPTTAVLWSSTAGSIYLRRCISREG